MIKLTITRGKRMLGTLALDKEQCLWLEAFAVANECDIASMIKRAINFAIAPEPRNGALDEPVGFTSANED